MSSTPNKSPSTSGKSVRASPIPGLSLIYYNGDRQSNVLSMKDDFSTSMVSKHGMIATCIETNEAHVEEEVEEMVVVDRPVRPIRVPALALDAKEQAAAAHAAAVGDYEEAIETYNEDMAIYKIRLAEAMRLFTDSTRKRKERIENGYRTVAPKLFADIMLQLSKESEDIIRNQPTFTDINATRNPVALWALIIKTHTMKLKQDVAETQAAANDAYAALRHGDKESMADIKRRTDNALSAMEAAGLDLPSAALQAQNFTNRLNASYSQLILSYSNKLKPKPTSLAEAYADALDHRVLSKNGTAVNVSDATVFAFNSDKAKPSKQADAEKKDKGKKKGGKANVEPPKTPAKTPAGPPAATASVKKEFRPPTRDCPLCSDLPDASSKRHYPSDCPRLPAIKELVKDGTIAAALSRPAVESDAVVLAAHAEPALSTRYLDFGVILAAVTVRLKWYHVLLDNQASVCCFKNMLSNVAPAQVPLRINGVGGSILTDQVGTLPTFEALEIYYSKDILANVLCFAQVADIYPITWDQDAMAFVVHTGNQNIHFFRKGDIFVADFRPILLDHQDEDHSDDDAEDNPDDNPPDYQSDGDHTEDPASDREDDDLPDVPDLVSDDDNSDSEEDTEFTAVAQVNTVEKNKAPFTKREVLLADQALQLMERLGHPSIQSAAAIISNSTIMNIPVSATDLRRASEIYGPSVASLRGKTTSSKRAKIKAEPTTMMSPTEVQLYIDIFFVDSEPYLLSLVMPSNTLMVNHLSNRSTPSVKKAISSHLSKISSFRKLLTIIFTDGEGALKALTDWLGDLKSQLDVTAAGEHVELIERCIRELKERCRAILSTLPYKLPRVLMPWLIYFVVSRINLTPSTVGNNFIAPREQLTGVRPDFNRDLRVSFGEYVETHEPDPQPISLKSNVRTTRTEAAIALLPMGNFDGSVMFFCLSTKGFIKRDRWTPLPMTNNCIQFLNSLAAADTVKVSTDPIFKLGNEIIESFDYTGLDQPIKVSPTYEESLQQPVFSQSDMLISSPDDVPRGHVIQDIGDTTAETPLIQVPSRGGEDLLLEPLSIAKSPTDEPPSTVVKPIKKSGSPVKATKLSIMEPVVLFEPPPSGRPSRHPRRHLTDIMHEAAQRSLPKSSVVEITKEIILLHVFRARQACHRQSQSALDAKSEAHKSKRARHEFGLHFSVKKAVAKFGTSALKSIAAECIQLINKKVFHPIDAGKLSTKERRAVIRSTMFLKEKFLSNGDFEKLKARLVAGGDQQDKSLYEDLSSPTVTTQSVFMVAATAGRERRRVVVIDISGAYLNADLTGIKVRMRLDPLLSAIIAQLDIVYEKFIEPDGSIVVELDKALYGCVESARLWYDHISTTLTNIGFVKNPHDICVFNLQKDGKQCTVCLHVDDLLITCVNESIIESVISSIEAQYKTITVHTGNVHSYLGMTFDFSVTGKVRVSMEGYIRDIVLLTGVTGKAATPAGIDLFMVDPASPKLDEQDREKFHSIVAKVLYLAKRVRPDLLTTCTFLAGRVLFATKQDDRKLDRMMRYINSTMELGITFDMSEDMSICAFIDASYGVHADGKSHSGAVITLGKHGPVHAKSNKQKLVTKSSTEAELVSLSDNISQVIWTRDFLMSQGYNMKAAIVYQDNMSTMALAEKGRSTAEKTRHINIRYFFVKDRVEAGEIEIKYCPTEYMIADILTKPLQGQAFRDMRDILLNC